MGACSKETIGILSFLLFTLKLLRTRQNVLEAELYFTIKDYLNTYRVTIASATQSSGCHKEASIANIFFMFSVSNFSLDLVCVISVAARPTRMFRAKSDLIVHIPQYIISIASKACSLR
jgi:hypothetical protein